MLTLLQRGTKNLLSGTLLSFINKPYFHFPFTVMGLDLGWNKGPVTTVSLDLAHLNGNNFNQNILPYAYENCKYLLS